MLHACYLLTGAQAEGLREGPRPVGIEAVQLHRRVGAIACAHAARDRPRGRTPVRVPVATAAVTSERGRATPFSAIPPQYARLGAAQRLGRGFPQNPVIPGSFARTNGKTPDRINGKRTGRNDRTKREAYVQVATYKYRRRGAGSPVAGAWAPGMLGRGGSGGMATATGPMGARATSDGSLTGRGLLDRGLGGGDLLAGSAFSLTRETHQGGLLSFWSRGAQSQFAGREGALSRGGDGRTTMVGADYAKGPVVAGGVAVPQPGPGRVRRRRRRAGGLVGDRPLPVAGLPGDRASHGVGRGGRFRAGVQGRCPVGRHVDRRRRRPGAGRLAATDAAVTRFRTGLEGARDYTLAGRLSLRPSVEVGLRHDGGDAESGAGLVVGSGLVLADASTGLAVDLRVRMLVLHQAEGFRERDLCLLVVTALYGISCSFRGTAGAGAVPVP